MLLLAAKMRLKLNRQGSASHAKKRKRYARLTPANQSHSRTVVTFVVVNVAAGRENAIGVEPVRKREPRGETQALHATLAS